jgi:hypothetical protein
MFKETETIVNEKVAIGGISWYKNKVHILHVGTCNWEQEKHNFLPRLFLYCM